MSRKNTLKKHIRWLVQYSGSALLDNINNTGDVHHVRYLRNGRNLMRRRSVIRRAAMMGFCQIAPFFCSTSQYRIQAIPFSE
jgi:hypothetical protein